MSYLRTRYRAMHQRFGTAGMIIAVIALVAALGGTALAAKGALTGKQKKEVEKIAKKFQGTGPAGTNGTNGTNGKDGAPGAAGTNGTNGSNGKSVVVTGTASGCDEGGASVEVEGTPASKQEICDGEAGEEGPEGSPWTDGGTLPPGAVETGMWTAVEAENFGFATVPISFTVPLPIRVAPENIFFGTGREAKEIELSTGQPAPETPFEERCQSLKRTAPIQAAEQPSSEQAGVLCLFYSGSGPSGFAVTRNGDVLEGAGPSGGYLRLDAPDLGNQTFYGSYAVRGCSTTLPEGDPDKCP